MKKIILLLVVFFMCLQVSAERVLFYEVGGGGEYAIESGYSEFARILRTEGFDIATISRGELSKKTLENYDILIMQNTQKGLSTNEISAIIWFVLNNGKGLFINGDGGGSANQLTVPFGVTIDDGILIDITDPIPGKKDKTVFTVDRFSNDPILNDIRTGVSKIGFYNGRGIVVSGDTLVVYNGDSDTYSDTGSFPSGSQPPLAAASLLGNGKVFINTDADVFKNANIGEYHNRRLAVNIINWLRTRTTIEKEGTGLQELKIVWGELKIELDRFSESQSELEVVKQDLLSQNNNVKETLRTTKAEIVSIKEGLVGPFTKANLTLMGFGIAIFIAAGIASSRKKDKIDTDIGDLEYEMGLTDESKGAVDEETLEDELDDLDI